MMAGTGCVMRVKDAEHSIHSGLRGLAWRPYLAAMWILCGELQSLYAEELGDAERPLMASTMDLVRDVAIAGETTALADRAAELADAWNRLRDIREEEDRLSALAGDTSPRLIGVWLTFEALTQEIAGLSGRYDGAEWVAEATTDRWRIEDPGQTGPIWMNPDETADDASPVARTLTTFERVIAGVAAARDYDWDPIELRAQ